MPRWCWPPLWTFGRQYFSTGPPAGLVGKIVERDPDVASGGAGEVFAPDLVALRRQLGTEAVRIERLRPDPVDLRCFRVDIEPSLLTDRTKFSASFDHCRGVVFRRELVILHGHVSLLLRGCPG